MGDRTERLAACLTGTWSTISMGRLFRSVACPARFLRCPVPGGPRRSLLVRRRGGHRTGPEPGGYPAARSADDQTPSSGASLLATGSGGPTSRRSRSARSCRARVGSRYGRRTAPATSALSPQSRSRVRSTSRCGYGRVLTGSSTAGRCGWTLPPAAPRSSSMRSAGRLARSIGFVRSRW